VARRGGVAPVLGVVLLGGLCFTAGALAGMLFSIRGHERPVVICPGCKGTGVVPAPGIVRLDGTAGE